MYFAATTLKRLLQLFFMIATFKHTQTVTLDNYYGDDAYTNHNAHNKQQELQQKQQQQQQRQQLEHLLQLQQYESDVIDTNGGGRDAAGIVEPNFNNAHYPYQRQNNIYAQPQTSLNKHNLHNNAFNVNVYQQQQLQENQQRQQQHKEIQTRLWSGAPIVVDYNRRDNTNADDYLDNRQQQQHWARYRYRANEQNAAPFYAATASNTNTLLNLQMRMLPTTTTGVVPTPQSSPLLTTTYLAHKYLPDTFNFPTQNLQQATSYYQQLPLPPLTPPPPSPATTANALSNADASFLATYNAAPLPALRFRDYASKFAPHFERYLRKYPQRIQPIFNTNAYT